LDCWDINRTSRPVDVDDQFISCARSPGIIILEKRQAFWLNGGAMGATMPGRGLMKKNRLLTAVTCAVITNIAAGQTAPRERPKPSPPHRREAEIGWRLDPADQKYAAIEGQHLMQYVNELTAMSRKYRDNGHPQFWGRIIGTEADTENAEWMLAKFRRIGLADVHEQYFDLPPQWMPQSWSAVASVNGKTLSLDSAQPTYLGKATPAGGIDVDAVYVGMGSEADIKFARDVKGKAVFFFSNDTGSRHVGISDNAIKRLSDRGAAAIFVILGVPMDERTQFYPVNAPVPTFSIGIKDGLAMRDMIAQAAGEPIHLKLNLDVKMTSGLKSGTVWGTLPGTTDENVIMVAHRDGWFEGANDNATGVATLVGVAEYFAKVPKEQRRRSIIFAGSTGHHNNSAESGAWFADHPETFAKTALLFNSEHTGLKDTGPGLSQFSNSPSTYRWYAGDSPTLINIAVKALDAFGVPTFPDSVSSPPGEIGRYYQYAPSVEIINTGYVWHSDKETPDTISIPGMAAVTRAYAKIIADTDKVERQALHPPAR
jgi:hypothetical protein